MDAEMAPTRVETNGASLGRQPAAAAVLAYTLALAVGIALAATLLPAAYVLATDPLGPALTGDPASHLVAMRYFIAAPWSWPPLLIRSLGEPPGTNLGLADGIPLASITTKLLRGVLPPGFQPLGAWLALSYALQPVAAVFAVRCAGERRIAPALAAAILAGSLPMWLAHSIHAALSAHFLILLAIGLYCRACHGQRWALASAALLAASLTVHPYLMAMVAAVLAAIPLSLLARGDKRWARAALAVAGALAGTGVLAATLGYGGLQPAGGFGVYSANLLGPIYPARSALLPGYADLLDATGGQWEGTAYLGMGLLLLLLLASGLALSTRWRGWRRHAGLVLVCAALAVFALSDQVYAGSTLVMQWPAPPGFIQQFRASGRFVWPVTYAALIWAVVLIARVLPLRAATTVLTVAAALQWADIAPYRRDVARELDPPKPWLFDAGRVGAMLAGSKTLSIVPHFYCGADAFAEPALAQLLVLASRTAIPVDSFFSARRASPAACGGPPQALQPGELRFYVTRHPAAALALPNGLRDCRILGGFAVCSQNTDLLAGLPTLPDTLAPALPIGQSVSAGADLAPSSFPYGWTDPQPGGRWTLGSGAMLLMRLPPTGRLTLHLTGFALAPVPGGTQDIDLLDGDDLIGHWLLADRAESTLDATLPATAAGRPLALRLRIGQPVRPVDRGINGDTRPLGFFLRSIQVGGSNG